MKINEAMIGKFGVINERSHVDSEVIISGECIMCYENYDSTWVVIVRDSSGRMYQTYSKFFITDANKLKKLYDKVSSRFRGISKECDRLRGKKETEEGFLLNRSWFAHPSWITICQCFDCTEALAETDKELSKYMEKLNMLGESLDNICSVVRINSVNFSKRS